MIWFYYGILNYMEFENMTTNMKSNMIIHFFLRDHIETICYH